MDSQSVTTEWGLHVGFWTNSILFHLVTDEIRQGINSILLRINHRIDSKRQILFNFRHKFVSLVGLVNLKQLSTAPCNVLFQTKLGWNVNLISVLYLFSWKLRCYACLLHLGCKRLTVSFLLDDIHLTPNFLDSLEYILLALGFTVFWKIWDICWHIRVLLIWILHYAFFFRRNERIESLSLKSVIKASIILRTSQFSLVSTQSRSRRKHCIWLH